MLHQMVVNAYRLAVPVELSPLRADQTLCLARNTEGISQ